MVGAWTDRWTGGWMTDSGWMTMVGGRTSKSADGWLDEWADVRRAVD